MCCFFSIEYLDLSCYLAKFTPLSCYLESLNQLTEPYFRVFLCTIILVDYVVFVYKFFTDVARIVRHSKWGQWLCRVGLLYFLSLNHVLDLCNSCCESFNNILLLQRLKYLFFFNQPQAVFFLHMPITLRKPRRSHNFLSLL